MFALLTIADDKKGITISNDGSVFYAFDIWGLKNYVLW